jgi:aminopeptidase
LPCRPFVGDDCPVSSREKRLAELAVRVGVNLQPGQDVVVLVFDVEQAPVARSVAEAAYARGANFVSVIYWDQHVKRSRLAHAPEESLDFVPDWCRTMVSEAVERRSAVVIVWGDPRPRLLEGLPSERVARDHMPLTPDMFAAVGRSEVSWTFIPGPCPGLAEAMLGAPELDRLWEILTPILRLDAPDPARAWREHIERLQGRAEAMERHKFHALRFLGGGTDLTVGLLQGARWLHAGLENATCHIALGNAYAFTVSDLPEDAAAQRAIGFNGSAIHQDVMIGGPEVQVFGLHEAGPEVPVIADDAWVLS